MTQPQSNAVYEEAITWFQDPKPNGTGTMCTCPNHEDRRRSLHISPGYDGKVVIKCHSGCRTEDILARVGKKMEDLFPPKTKASPKEQPLSITAYDYVDENRVLLYQSVRKQFADHKEFFQRKPKPGGGWLYSLDGVRRVLFHLPEIRAAIEHGEYILTLEGEKDVLRAEAEGANATCNVGGAGKGAAEYAEHLANADVVIICDNDRPGFAHGLNVYRSLTGKAASILIVQLLGIPEKGDLSDWLDLGGKMQDIERLIAGKVMIGAKLIDVDDLSRLAGETPTDSTYSHIHDEDQKETREFPTDVFPAALDRYIREGAESINVATDMIAIPMMGFAAGVIGNSCAIALKSKWIERLNLWLAVIGEPGSGKSPATDYARAPIDDLQKEAYQVYLGQVKEWEAEVAAQKADKKNKDPLPDKPALEHFFTTDATTEALAGMLAFSPGVTMVRDELVGWVKSFDAYRQGGDRQSYLSLWAGAPLKVDRRSSGTTYVPHPCVPIVGGIQPEILSDLGEEANRRDGFIERFLMVWPEAKPQLWSDADSSSGARWEVDRIFKALRIPAKTDDGNSGLVFFLSDEAKQVFASWYNENGEIVKSTTGIAAGCYAKYPGQLARIALVLHCLHHPGERGLKVDAETMTKAVTVIEYFRQQLIKILPKFASAGSSKTAGLAPRIMRVLAKHNGEWIPRETIRKGLGNSVPADDIKAALEALSAAGKAENRTVPTGAKPREESRDISREYVNMWNQEDITNSTYSHMDDGDEEEVRV